MIRKISLHRFLVTASRGAFVPAQHCLIQLRHFTVNSLCNAKAAKVISEKKLKDREYGEALPEIVQYASDKDIIYSSYISNKRVKLNYRARRAIEERFKVDEIKRKKDEAIPLIIEKMLSQDHVSFPYESNMTQSKERETRLNLPYSTIEKISVSDLELDSNSEKEPDWDNSKLSVRDDVANRMQAYEEELIRAVEITDGNLAKDSHVKEFATSIALEDASHDVDEDPMEYGTCDPNVPVSSVPCGGCGAHLHCQQYSLPGFIPKELFEGLDKGELRSIICQRCYFLKHHNMALNVRVSPDVYQQILEPIKKERALVIVVVDLLDVPCSIWPKMIDIVGTRRPVVIVGNKVDLLPADGRNHLRRIKDSLTAAVESTSLGRANIKHVALVSAHTGFGIESLITKVQNSWGTKGDVYIVGCTNAGKSTLFNALLGSDMCKTHASDLVRRATTSPWPGTTLNMLKFPLLRPSGYRLYLRVQRLKQMNEERHLKEKINEKYTTNIALATLSGPIGRTFVTQEPEETLDPFSTRANAIPKDSNKILGIKESHPRYATGKWCYDTPGTVQPDQMINLLSHEELMKVLPCELIQPRTYAISSGKTLFIGGLARLDLVYSSASVRLTVFAASSIPVTIVKTVDASAFYRNYLGTSLLGVPLGGEERLKHWPALAPCDLRMTSHDREQSCADVVLSSAGWIAITGSSHQVIEVRGWTPGGRGIHLRNPSMLPRIISLRGVRLDKSPAYKPHKLLIPKSDI